MFVYSLLYFLTANLANKNVSVSLYDKSGLVEEQRMLLNESGINNTTFNYLAKEVGKQYLTVLVSELESEESISNNKYHFTFANRHRQNPGFFTTLNRSLRPRKPQRSSLNFSTIARVGHTNRASSTHYGYRF